MDEIQIPKKVELQTKLENEKIVLSKGSTTIIVGANGTGKTRLAVYIEEQLKEKAHRISAHRALKLNPNVNKIPEKSAKTYLSYGQNWDGIDVSNRKNYRWDNNSYTHLLNDFDWLLQYLFAQQNNIAVANNQKLNRNEKVTNSKTKLDILQEAWETLLPHRKLHITADDIQVSAVDNEELYSASNMSDGERALFYILGQILSVDDGSVLIFDEPELHIHKSIISNLWDKIEELRPDCSFLIITHDIEFAATRVAKKYVIRNYYPTPAWDISEVPESNFDEETITMILGSRKPILFVEGNNNSLDIATYRYCYPDWTIIPKGACKDVIQSVSSLKKLSNEMPLLNLKCSGIVDLDSRDEREIEQLNNLGIYILPVSEIENLFSLTDVAKEILKLNQYSDEELLNKLNGFKSELIKYIDNELKDDKLDEFVVKQVRRKIDNYLKNIDLSSKITSTDMKKSLLNEISTLTEQKIETWISEIKNEIQRCIEQQDLDKLLTIYDNKGLLAKSACVLKGMRNKHEFESWIMRTLKGRNKDFIDAIRQKLPILD
ncbi:TPA: AAA family ATPase [Neisseria meningitidis]